MKAYLASQYFRVAHSVQGVSFWDNIIDGKLWMGNLAQARNRNWLEKTGITHICSITQWGEGTRFFDDEYDYFTINIEDKPHCDLLMYLDQAVGYIKNAVDEGGKVYVHCNQGRSRSGTVVVAYYIQEFDLDVKSALTRVQAKRSVVSPNRGFLQQLEKWRQLCVFRKTLQDLSKYLNPHLMELSNMGIAGEVCFLIGEYVCGAMKKTEDEDKATYAQRAIAEMATMFFMMTHRFQGIPYQNNIIPDRLWLGQLGAARNYKWLRESNITRVCSVTQWGKATKFWESKGIRYHIIHIEDKPDKNILNHLDKAVEFIDSSLKDGHNVLVHCNQGRSRSATVLTAYFIKTRGSWKKVQEHIGEIKKKRPAVSPNSGFVEQLRLFRARCIITNTLETVLRGTRGPNAPFAKIASLVSRYVT
ncbi:hypothetical protein AAMO2058_000431600 [Amorphochlora amoebiformis]